MKTLVSLGCTFVLVLLSLVIDANSANRTVSVHCVDGVTGQGIKGVVVSVSVSGSQTVIDKSTTDLSGNCFLNIPAGKSYDFTAQWGSEDSIAQSDVYVGGGEGNFVLDDFEF